MSITPRIRVVHVACLFACAPILLSVGCKTTQSTADGNRGAAAPAKAPILESDTLHIQRSTAQNFMKLDRICWRLTLEWQRPKDQIEVTLNAQYDTGTTGGKGVYFTGSTAREVIDKALAEIEGQGKETAGIISSEDEVLRLADGLTVINRNGWYLKLDKSGDWTVTAKVLKPGDLRGKTHRATNKSLLAAVNEVRDSIKAANK